MRTTPIAITVGNKETTYHLRLDVEALINLSEMANIDELCDALLDESESGRIILCRVVEILSEQGELTRRYYGYDHSEMLTSKKLQAIKDSYNISALRLAAISAIAEGVVMEKDQSNEPIDLGLKEIREKNTEKIKNQRLSRAQLLTMGAMCGKSEKETLLCRPCVLLKQFELIKESKKVKT